MCGKLDFLELTLQDLRTKGKEVDVICLSETFVKRGSEANIKLSNFKLAASYCRPDEKRGGTCILIKKYFDFKPIPFTSSLATSYYFECCGIEILGTGLIIINIYRIPKQIKSHVGIFLHKLEKLLYSLTSKYKQMKLIVCGDWNINLLNPNSATKDLLSVLKNYNIDPHILTPTRKDSCIDQIASNMKSAVSEVLHLGLSDHETAQFLTLKFPKQVAFSTWFEYQRDYNNQNIKKFCDSISALSFSDILSSSNTIDAFNNFYELICLFYELCFPVIKIKINNRPKNLNWVTKGIKRSIKTKRFLYTQYQRVKLNKRENKSKFRKYSRLLKKCINHAQKIKSRNYIQNHKNKCKATWNTISTKVSTNYRQSDISQIKSDNKIYSDPIDICNIFNNYFIELTNKINLLPNSMTCNNSNRNKIIPHTIFLRPVSENEIYNIIMSLKNSKASGYDYITTRVLKLCAPYICRPLAHIINLSYVEGIFPEKLKISIVTPLYKKGNHLDPVNYRPITLVPVMSKVFERAIQTRLNEFLVKHKILRPEQYGFRKGSSTTHACFELIRTVTENINKNTPSATIFLDMSKAFDFVNHSKLLNKLNFYGIRGRAFDWIESFLKNRQQCTEISKIVESGKTLLKKTYRSHFRTNNTGVPQGSVLGPLLFLLYVNNLPDCTEHKCIQFADDTTLVVKSNKQLLDMNMNNALNNIITWMDANDLQINISKTKFMQFRSYNSRPIPLSLNYNSERVDEVDTYNFLGITIDKHLNWKEQVDQVCNKLNRFVFALKRLKQTISLEAALTAYHGYVSSVLSYGLILWGNSVDISRAFKLQKKCIRVLCSAAFDDSCRPLFKKLNVLPLPCMYIRDVCTFVHLNPQYWSKRGDIIERQTRTRYMNLLHQPHCHKDIYKRNVNNMCILLYNKLPDDIKLLPKNSFKHGLTKWLLQHSFYSVKEYLEYNF